MWKYLKYLGDSENVDQKQISSVCFLVPGGIYQTMPPISVNEFRDSTYLYSPYQATSKDIL